MFTWICPQCGREVPPAYDDCPDCKARATQAGGAVPPGGQPMPPEPPPPPQQPPPSQHQPVYYQQQAQQPPSHYAPQASAPPPPPPQQQQQYYAPPPQAAPQGYYPPPPPPPPPAHGMNLPIWLMTILFAFAIGGVVLGIVWLASSNHGSAGTGPTPTATVESPAAKPGQKASAMQKYIEVTGVRFVQDAKKKTQVKFVVINHSEADISGLSGNVTVWGRTRKSEEDAQGTFSFSTNLAPFESKELTVPLNSKLKIYELGDWQNITTDVQITAPAGG
jgi:hypothetical protein